MKQFCSFAEAIREGAKMSSQYFGSRVNEARTATCAYGAGVHAIVGTLEPRVFQAFDPLDAYPYLGERAMVKCPDDECTAQRPHIFLMIFHLNDHHQWGREQIADWLESEEEKLGFVHLVETESSGSQTEAVSEMVMV